MNESNTIQQNLRNYFEEQKQLSGSEYPELIGMLSAWRPQLDAELIGTRATQYFAIMFRAYLDRGRIMTAVENDSFIHFLRIPYAGGSVDLIVRGNDALEPIVAETAGRTFAEASQVPVASLDPELIELAIHKAEIESIGTSTIAILRDLSRSARRAAMRVA
jgi:hypothetical protein